jgi:hypothetical protein
MLASIMEMGLMTSPKGEGTAFHHLGIITEQ